MIARDNCGTEVIVVGHLDSIGIEPLEPRRLLSATLRVGPGETYSESSAAIDAETPESEADK